MDLRKVQLITSQAADVADKIHAEIKIQDVTPEDKYILKAASGLGVDDIFKQDAGYFINPYTPEFTYNYYDMLLKERVVNLVVDINPDYSEDEMARFLRDEIYKSISYSRQKELELRFSIKHASGSSDTASLFGDITKVEGDIFSADSQVGITFKCLDPFFKSVSEIEYDDPDHWGGEPDVIEVTDDYSTAPHGFRIVFTFDEDCDSFKIYNSDNEGFTVVHDFLDGQELHFSSEFNNRDIFMYVSGDKFSMMDKIAPGSVWPVMKPGDNQFKMFEPFGDAHGAVNLFYYRKTYWGA